MPRIIPYQTQWQAPLIDLWQQCGLTRPWNDPQKDIQRKQQDTQGRLWLLVKSNAQSDLLPMLLGSVMVGYDGHRGSINYLAISPTCQHKGYGRQLMDYCEQWLLARGCPKVNLCVRDTNVDVMAFYGCLGYQKDPVVVLSKRLLEDE